MSQQINCFNCDHPLHIRIDPAGYVHRAVPDHDSEPLKRYDDKGKPVKGKLPPALFHVRDRKKGTQKQKTAKGILEDVDTEEPMSAVCPKCGHKNMIY